jgi:hypothetical protein
VVIEFAEPGSLAADLLTSKKYVFPPMNIVSIKRIACFPLIILSLAGNPVNPVSPGIPGISEGSADISFVNVFRYQSAAPRIAEGGIRGMGVPAVSRHGQAESFLLISDIHLSVDKTASYDKDPNDTNKELWDFTRKKINEVLSGRGSLGKTKWKKPSFILFLGDMPLHKGDVANMRKNDSIVMHDLREIAESAHCPLVYVPGNNDSGAGDYFPFDAGIFGMDAAFANAWPMVGVDTAGGKPDGPRVERGRGEIGANCYSAFPLGTEQGKNLRVIGINSVVFTPAYYTKVAHEQVQSITDGELDCLQEQLRQADSLGEKVVIAMHVPPGFDGYKKSDMWDTNLRYHNGNKTMLNEFLDLVKQYRQRIVGMVGSHTHMDGLRRVYDSDHAFNSFMLSVPGIDPGHGNNPAFKLVTYDKHSFEWEDAITFYDPFYPAKMLQDWGDHAFSLRDQLGCPAGVTLRGCIGTPDDSVLEKGLLPVYKAKAPTTGKDADEMHRSLNVRPD